MLTVIGRRSSRVDVSEDEGWMRRGIDTEQFNVVGRRERHRSPRPRSSRYCSNAMMALAASISVVAVVGLILPFFDDVFTELMNELS